MKNSMRLNRLAIVLLVVPGVFWAIQDEQAETAPSPVMIAAVSRDISALRGGIGYGKRTKAGEVEVEPIAFLAASGEWEALPCTPGTGAGCRKFARQYLSKRHTFSVVSADGKGAIVTANPVVLSECYGYNGTGTYSGGHISKSAIAAASSMDLFDTPPPLTLANLSEASQIRQALRPLAPQRLDSVEDLRLFHLQLENSDLLIVQRAYMDNIDPKNFTRKLIFGIGHVEKGRFVVLHWKQNTSDEQEEVLGTIRMMNGRDFLITTVSDPESQSFRIYGIHNGKLKLVFSGGGSSC